MKKTNIIRVAVMIFLGGNALAQSNTLTATPARPERPAQSGMPEDVKARLADFKAARETFLASQRELTSQLKQASTEEQARIRAELRDQREQFKMEAKEFGQQTRESVAKVDHDLVRKLATENASSGRRR